MVRSERREIDSGIVRAWGRNTKNGMVSGRVAMGENKAREGHCLKEKHSHLAPVGAWQAEMLLLQACCCQQ